TGRNSIPRGEYGGRIFPAYSCVRPSHVSSARYRRQVDECDRRHGDIGADCWLLASWLFRHSTLPTPRWGGLPPTRFHFSPRQRRHARLLPYHGRRPGHSRWSSARAKRCGKSHRRTDSPWTPSSKPTNFAAETWFNRGSGWSSPGAPSIFPAGSPRRPEVRSLASPRVSSGRPGERCHPDLGGDGSTTTTGLISPPRMARRSMPPGRGGSPSRGGT